MQELQNLGIKKEREVFPLSSYNVAPQTGHLLPDGTLLWHFGQVTVSLEPLTSFEPLFILLKMLLYAF